MLKKSNEKDSSFKVPKVKIEVIGIGGGGCKIAYFLASEIKNLKTTLIDKDFKLLKSFKKGKLKKILLTKEEHKDKKLLEKYLKPVDLSLVVACLGGETTKRYLALILEILEKKAKINLGIFIFPFAFEGEKKSLEARDTLKKVLTKLEGVMVLSNQKVFESVAKSLTFNLALQEINKTLAISLENLIEVLRAPQLINIDFADLRELFKKSKGNLIYLNSISISKETKLEEIEKRLFQNPFLEIKLDTPKKILLSLEGGPDLELYLFEKIAEKVYVKNPSGRIIIGLNQIKSLQGKLRILILAIGKAEVLLDKNSKTKYQKEKKLRKVTKMKRKTSLELQKEKELQVKKILEEDSKWDKPAFLESF